MQPLVGSLPVNSSVFIVTENTKKILESNYPEMDTYTKTLVASSWAGFCTLGILVPAELLKCRAQMTKDGRMNYKEEIASIWR